MKIIDAFFAHSDDRGQIWDILVGEVISSISYVTFNKGAIRGNHIHKRTAQWNYVFSGSIKVVTEGLKQESDIINAGKIFLIEPGVAHAMKAIEESQLFVFTLGDRAGTNFEEDTYRLEQPLII